MRAELSELTYKTKYNFHPISVSLESSLVEQLNDYAHGCKQNRSKALRNLIKKALTDYPYSADMQAG